MFIIIKPMRRQKSINKTFTHTCSHQYLAKFSNRCNFRFHFECHLPAGSAALKFNLGGKLIITQQCGCSEHTSIYSRVYIPIVIGIYIHFEINFSGMCQHLEAATGNCFCGH